MKMKLAVLGLLLLMACKGPKGDPGQNASGVQGPSGDSGSTGPMGPMGLMGPAGLNATTPFSFGGTYAFPQTTVTQIVPNLNLDAGDVLNVYISWQGQPWTQIGSTWVGGMAGSYAVTGNAVTITTVIGPAAPMVQWTINGVHKT
jgi:hypothetical protein